MAEDFRFLTGVAIGGVCKHTFSWALRRNADRYKFRELTFRHNMQALVDAIRFMTPDKKVNDWWEYYNGN